MSLSEKLESFLTTVFSRFPWKLEIIDMEGRHYLVGGNIAHWTGRPTLEISLQTRAAMKDMLSLNGLRFLERFLAGEIHLKGNLYALGYIRKHADVDLSLFQYLQAICKNYWLQNIQRTRINVKSHYDIPQDALSLYLDKIYMAYSCAMFEQPKHLNVEELRRAGKGQDDDFDSLEKAQWRKFKDAVDFVNPEKGETLLDIGCGYGGQLKVALEQYPLGKAVGWTLSANQIAEGKKLLSKFDPSQWEIREGDYRESDEVFDHITSTGMACHVGPRGLIPYVRNVRKRIRQGGRYVHHVLMTPRISVPLDKEAGVAFNKKYVWPGFHWFTLSEHINALERNGFRIKRAVNLSPHYAKTAAAWYERLSANEEIAIELMGIPTYRAWQIYLAGGSGSIDIEQATVNRIYCEAV